MKTLLIGFSILFVTSSALATATATQIQRAQEVLKRSLLPTQLVHLSPEKFNSSMKEVTYEALRPRDILRVTEDIKNIYHRHGKALVDRQHEGFADSNGKTVLQKGEFFRVVQVYKSNDTDWTNKKDFSGVQGEYIEVLEFTAVKLDQNFEPVGDNFFLVVRGGADRKVPNVQRFDGGFMARNPSLSFNRAGVNDLIVNAQAIETDHGVIPAFSPAIITKIERTRMNWTISNYNYVFTLHLINCPQQFREQKCNVQIKGTKMYANPHWAHYTMPENRREIKLWGGMSLMY